MYKQQQYLPFKNEVYTRTRSFNEAIYAMYTF